MINYLFHLNYLDIKDLDIKDPSNSYPKQVYLLSVRQLSFLVTSLFYLALLINAFTTF